MNCQSLSRGKDWSISSLMVWKLDSIIALMPPPPTQTSNEGNQKHNGQDGDHYCQAQSMNCQSLSRGKDWSISSLMVWKLDSIIALMPPPPTQTSNEGNQKHNGQDGDHYCQAPSVICQSLSQGKDWSWS